MTSLSPAVRLLTLASVAAILTGCTTTTHEVEVVHVQPKKKHYVVVHHHHDTSTAPQDYGVVNQYDRQSR